MIRASREAAADAVRTWREALGPDACADVVDEVLAAYLCRLLDALVHGEPAAGAAIGADVAADEVTRGAGLGRTLAALGTALRTLEPELDPVALLAAVADGYAGAERRRERADLEAALSAAQERFDAVLAASSAAIAVTDLDGTVVRANPAVGALAGAPERVVGARMGELLGMTGVQVPVVGAAPDSRDRARHQMRDGSGEPAWGRVEFAELSDGRGTATHRLVVVEDVTELHLLQQRLAAQALHDVLTGLPNHHYFISHTERVLAGEGTAAMFMVDLDGLTGINDGLGRGAGDQVIREGAARMHAVVPKERAMLARTCGAGYAVLLEESPTVAQTTDLAERILAAFEAPMQIDGRTLRVTVGIGVVHKPTAGLSAKEMVRQADATLHRVKCAGRAQWGFHDGPSDAEQQERARLAALLDEASRAGDLTVEYEPVDFGDGTPAVQALLRWDRADGGPPLSHEECMALAEQSGLIVQLGRWVLREACTDASGWRAVQGDGAALLRVDLTSRLLQDPDLVLLLRDTLAATGVPLEQLRLGLPLAPLQGDCGDARDNARTLADMGARLVLLDGGTEPGFLEWLDELPVHAVQLDPDLVHRTAVVPGQQSVVDRSIRPTLGLVHSAGSLVIAPHVDTPEQAAWWRAAGADGLRGRSAGPVVPSWEVPDLVAPSAP